MQHKNLVNKAGAEGALPRSKEPPHDLTDRDLPLVEVAGPFQRIYLSKYSPIHFGRQGKYRFDDPDGKTGQFGVLYLGMDDFSCFIECFGDSFGNTVSTDGLSVRSISQIVARRPLKVVDITGAGAAWISAAGEITAGEHALSQRWLRALWEHPAQPDDIYFRAKHDLSRFCLAVYNRAESLISSTETVGLLESTMAKRLGSMLNQYRFSLV